MDVKKALTLRHACRAFRQEPVKQETILEVIDDALLTPSWANTQPWTVYVAAGELLKEIRKEYLKQADLKIPAELDIPRPQKWPEAENGRIQRMMTDVSAAAENSGKLFGDANREFFHAPAVLFLCMDKNLGPWSMFDLGAFSQSVMLEATEQGLAAMPAVELVHYPQVLRKYLEIPESLSVVFGIAIGYEDKTHPLNRFKTSRKTMAETVIMRGF
jgi:nitroreductase